MKAKAYHFVNLQKPYTIFGLPMRLSGAWAGLSFFLYLFLDSMMDADFMMKPYMLPLFLLALMGGLAAIMIANKKDHHFETLLFLSAKFWKKRQERILLCGVPLANQDKFHKKGRKKKR